MTLSQQVRDQIISSFRSELAEHLQILNDGLLLLEQGQIPAENRQEKLADLFRAAHSLKGAARAVGVSAVEQLAHALEDALAMLQSQEQLPAADFFSACYQALDAIQATQAGYEAGQTSPPTQVLKSLMELEPFRNNQSSQVSAQLANDLSLEKTLDKNAADKETRMKSKLDLLMDDLKNGDFSSGTDGGSASEAPSVLDETSANSEPEEQTISSDNKKMDQPDFSHSSPSSDETVRVNVKKLDALMEQLSELLVTKIHAQQRWDQLRQVQHYMASWQKEWLAVRGAYSLLVRHGFGKKDSEADAKGLTFRRNEFIDLLDYMGTNQDHMHEMNFLINTLSREYQSDTMQMGLVIDGLEEEIKRVRMLPFSTITAPFARMVRDLAHESGKQAVLKVFGGDVELDRRVLEQIKDPIIHLLRNAVDHGIEMPEERLARGKPPTGAITLAAEHLGQEIAISVRDDGTGLDIASIRKTAQRHSIPDSATLNESELVDLIYQAGFSTSPIITDVSGRGVGLDVVRRNVEALRGRITLDWVPAMGSCFTLTMPLVLTSTRALMVRFSNQVFAVPLNSVERILEIRREMIETVGGRDSLRYNGRPLMLAHLSNVLGLPRINGNHTNGRIPVLILNATERRMAFVVDELISEQEVVIKGLGNQLLRIGGITGVSVMGNGEVVLILNVSDLIKLAHKSESQPTIDPISEDVSPIIKPQTRRILVVDDSITTRTLEKNILAAEGYDVQLATNGQEALDIVKAGDSPDLIISDVAMPRLDGFGLCQRIKKDPRTQTIPLILVTSLDSPEDKARGIECGADAYIVKSSFDQMNLLETIEQLI